MARRPPMCRFFRAGTCKNGARCLFSHEQDHPDANLCPFFAKGHCTYGARCMFDHHHPDASAVDAATHSGHTAAHASSPPVQQPSSPSTARPATAPCIYFARGHCQFGSGCRFRHECDAAVDAAAAQLSELRLPDSLSSTPAQASSSGNALASSLNLPDSLSSARPLPSNGAARQGTPPAAAAPRSAWAPPQAPQLSGLAMIDDSPDPSDPWEMHRRRPAQGMLRVDRTLMGGEAVGSLSLANGICAGFAAEGTCEDGATCPYVHGELCQGCHLFVLHPTDKAAAERHEGPCLAAFQKRQQFEDSRQKECGICFERVHGKPERSQRKFGLLECDHCFCIGCIRSWRSNSNVDIDAAARTCPECRCRSHFVTPAVVWPTSQEEKDEIVSSYKAHLASVPCRHFNSGAGTCPFGTSCFYKHELPDGTLERVPHNPARMATNADGEYSAVRPVMLSSFLDNERARALLRRPVRS